MTFEASFISGFMFFIKLVFILPRVDFGITLSFTLIASASREGLGTMLKLGLFRPNRPMWRHSKNWFSLQTKSFTKWTPLLGIIASFKLSQKAVQITFHWKTHLTYLRRNHIIFLAGNMVKSCACCGTRLLSKYQNSARQSSFTFLAICFFCFCPLGLVVKLSFGISKVAWSGLKFTPAFTLATFTTQGYFQGSVLSCVMLVLLIPVHLSSW